MLSASKSVFQRGISSAASARVTGSVVAAASSDHSLPGSSRLCRNVTTTTKGNIQVEHGRGQWKTYGDVESYKPGHFQIKTFNKLSPIGLSRFPDDSYDVISTENAEKEGKKIAANAHAILLRSYNLKEEDVPHTVRAIARCGAGTNNIPVARMTQLGIPVFNTPGANANAVMELVICGLFLGSRRIVDGINHMRQLGEQGLAKEHVEKDKALFGGREIAGKTLTVIGLGHIGSKTAQTASDLGMKTTGYDPGLSVPAALQLPRDIKLQDSITSAVQEADYISLNIPYIKGSPQNGGTHGIVGSQVLESLKPDCVILNFARGELVDSHAMLDFLNRNESARYITDFPDDLLWNHKNCIVLPHLGASTAEAEDAAASMAVDTLRDFLETGTIRHSVNFPFTFLPEAPGGTVRFTIVNRNKPGLLAAITEVVSNEDLNIVQQVNQSRGDIAYNIMDIDTGKHKQDILCFKTCQERITMLDGVLSSRIIYGIPGSGFAKNLEGEYFV